ncbi:MBL fold metallo-hydrolase [Pigmentiphaga sp.]|uniref:MBL fold metallo-hydrolase n=1 Tax=Pigmentiphaga sp. TaxID=1977564 RepID=UPI00128D5F25|nr:MBL fold metallo-hydrolase [Pigmentiphaga sp.]MPS26220.1 hydrolase [Alcaligenaceae bacterium SAGV5]MPS53272.1 hydrolase [Alcaligenaceae bacterium SAGV3]MPT57750.1 hydrolase [Alcaligenaceae bacterium]
MKRLFLVILLGIFAVTAIATCHRPALPSYPESPQHRDGRFHNPVPRPAIGLWQGLKLAWTFFFAKPDGTVPDTPIPVRALDRAQLEAAPDHSLYRLGHSTVLMKLRGRYWLTDPVFSRRASPVQWAGPARFHAPPIAIEDLPPIAGVILSHNHYDHLDHAAVAQLDAKTTRFITPLGVGDQLIAWGIDPAKVEQLDWWQSADIDGLRLTATPAQHFSGRGLTDSDRSLWASWVIQDAGLRVFFSGDSGYFDGFKKIGDAYGPFDLTLMETGAYDERWAFVHMQPEQTLQAHLDLRGRWLLPIHNGTFDLALHPWEQPFERILALAAAHRVALTTPVMGERIDMRAPGPGTPWWRKALRAEGPTPSTSQAIVR